MHRPLHSSDRKRVLQTLQAFAATRGVVPMRSRALIALALDSALRLQELVSLNLQQLLQDRSDRAVRLRSSFYLRPSQAKGGETGAGMVELSERCRAALRAYILELRRQQWIEWPPSPDTPLFIAHRGFQGQRGHGRLSKRSAQWCWRQVQKRAGLSELYTFHSLRNDSASRLRAAGGDIFDLMKHGRWRDMGTAQRYVHELDALQRAPELVKRASKL